MGHEVIQLNFLVDDGASEMIKESQAATSKTMKERDAGMSIVGVQPKDIFQSNTTCQIRYTVFNIATIFE